MKAQRLSRQHVFLSELTSRIINGSTITRDEAGRITALQTHEEIVMLMAHATLLRGHFKGAHIDLCAVVNAKSGRCAEDCIFCAQSAHHLTNVATYPLLDHGEIVQRAREAFTNGAERFGIVTSGRGVTSFDEMKTVCTAIQEITRNTRLVPCASLGVLSEEQIRELSAAGLKRYHHNLETAESHFPKICSTHTFQERVQTVRAARKAGIEVCSGALFGLGESPEQRAELAFALRDLDVDSIPLNFLNPVPGTPVEQFPPVAPLEILKTIALFRFVLPQKDIRVCGGREVGLRTLQPLMYLAGASGTMVGNYLTTSGRDPEIDLQEIEDLGLACRFQKDIEGC